MDKIIEKKGRFSRKQIIIALVGVAILIFILYVILGDKSTKLNVEKEKLTIETVSEDLFQDYISVIGNVEPIKVIYMDAMEGGRVEEIIAEEGSMLNEGDPILKLSNTNLLQDIMFRESELAERENTLRTTRLQMEQYRLNIKSQLLEAEYNLKRKDRNYKQYTYLKNSGSVSAEEFEQAKEDFEISKNRKELLIETARQDSLFREIQVSQLERSLHSMQQNLKLIKVKLESLTVRAPAHGQLASLIPELGQSIGQGMRLGQINVLDAYKLKVNIDEHYIARVSKGLNGTADFSEKEFRTKITKLYPEVKNGRFAVDMEFVSIIPTAIRIGQTSSIRLELGEAKKAILLPRGGFYQSTGGQWIYVLDASGNFAVKRKIQIGRQNPQFYEVIEGLKPNEKIITSGYENFGDADKLYLKEQN